MGVPSESEDSGKLATLTMTPVTEESFSHSVSRGTREERTSYDDCTPSVVPTT